MLFKLLRPHARAIALKQSGLPLPIQALSAPARLTSSRTQDFQGTPGVAVFNKFVKLGDSLILSMLLLKHDIIQKKIKNNEAITIHDVGGADGAMMLTLLRVLDFRAHITVNEPNQTRLDIYKKKQTQYPRLFSSIVGCNQKVEDRSFIMPAKRELILASHVLYYNRAHWLTCHTLSEHLLSKLFQSLCVNGILCVTLQYASLEMFGSHESWEDFTYSVFEDIKHGNNPFFASSDLFDAALNAYKKQFIYETGHPIDWIIHTDIAETCIPLGALNIFPDIEGKYPQSNDVLKIINFYLKGRNFEALSPDFQKHTIDFIVRNFKKHDQYEIVHYNKIYTIEVGKTLFSELNALNTRPAPKPF